LARNNINTPQEIVPNDRRDVVAWQWAATGATSEKMIGLDAENDQYPSYDIDGRLQEVIVYAFDQEDGDPIVTYQDPSGGDVDSLWDPVTSCSPKPGLQSNSQIYTFTKEGTYLQMKEGKLYNPESGQAVRSVSKQDTVDVIQRIVQLSNNTGRFCTKPKDGKPPQLCSGKHCARPNPVEVCVETKEDKCKKKKNGEYICEGGPCFTPENMAKTCYDTSLDRIFVRSRLKNNRGHFWMTNTTGELKVQ
jgi:hypothetical protein